MSDRPIKEALWLSEFDFPMPEGCTWSMYNAACEYKYKDNVVGLTLSEITTIETLLLDTTNPDVRTHFEIELKRLRAELEVLCTTN